MSTTIARLLAFALLAAGFGFGAWQLLATAPQSSRERPAVPMTLVDVIDSTPRAHALTLEAAGTVISAYEMEIRPQVGGRIVELHPDFAPGGRIAAGSTLLAIDPDDYRLAVAGAEADVAKARAAIALEQGRRVVAREELATLKGSVDVDPSSVALALRKPQLDQVQAELAAAENRLQQARLDLARTRVSLPFDVVVLERTRVAGEVVATRELVGRVTRADEYWVDLRTPPALLQRLSARSDDRPGSQVLVRGAAADYAGEVVHIRPDLAAGSRLGGVIVAVPVDAGTARTLPIGSYVKAEIAAGSLDDAVAVPRRAVRDNGRLWVVDGDDTLQVRDADVLWAAGQTLLLDPDALRPGDRVVVSRVGGLVPGARVRSRLVEPESGQTLASHAGSAHE